MADQDVSAELLERYRKVGAATVFSGVTRLGYGLCVMRGLTNFTPGTRLAARAKTLRFVPPRTDIAEESKRGRESGGVPGHGVVWTPATYSCATGLGKTTAAIGGDIKLLQLKMVGAEGVVTDASIRDMDAVTAYGFAVFAGGRHTGHGRSGDRAVRGERGRSVRRGGGPAGRRDRRRRRWSKSSCQAGWLPTLSNGVKSTRRPRSTSRD